MKSTNRIHANARRYRPRAVIVELIQSSYGSFEGTVLERVREVLLNIAESATADVVIDMSRVHYFGARFIGVLATTWKKLREHGRRLLLCGVAAYAQKLIKVLNLQKLFEVYADQADAIDELFQCPASKTNSRMASLRIGVMTDEVRWDRSFLRLSYLGDGVPLYSEIIPRN